MVMEGDPFMLIEGMTIVGHRRRRHEGLRLYAAPNIHMRAKTFNEALRAGPLRRLARHQYQGLEP